MYSNEHTILVSFLDKYSRPQKSHNINMLPHKKLDQLYPASISPFTPDYSLFLSPW